MPENLQKTKEGSKSVCSILAWLRSFGPCIMYNVVLSCLHLYELKSLPQLSFGEGNYITLSLAWD